MQPLLLSYQQIRNWPSQLFCHLFKFFLSTSQFYFEILACRIEFCFKHFQFVGCVGETLAQFSLLFLQRAGGKNKSASQYFHKVSQATRSRNCISLQSYSTPATKQLWNKSGSCTVPILAALKPGVKKSKTEYKVIYRKILKTAVSFFKKEKKMGSEWLKADKQPLFCQLLPEPVSFTSLNHNTGP